MPLATKRRLWLTVGLLWLLWAVRAHSILALPIFVDESLHMMRAQVVYDFTDAKASILPAKLLLYYYLGLFRLQDVGGAWVARQAVALLAPLGAALTLALTRQLFKRWSAGLLAMAFYGLMPFMLFFERMALADTFVMLFGLAFALLSVRLARQPSPRHAAYAGVAFGVALLAKLTALPWAALPLVAMWCFGRISWRNLVIVGAVSGLFLVPSVLYMAYQEINPPDAKVESVEQDLFVPSANSRFDQIRANVETYAEASRALFSLPFLLILFGVGAWQLYRTPRAVGFLLTFTLILWAFITLTAARPSTRYLVTGVPALLIIAAAGVDSLMQRPQWPYRLAWGVALGLCGLWALYGLNFLTTAWDDPAELPLAERDIWEYYQNSASGYGLREAAHDLPNLERLDQHPSGAPIPVIGFVGACHTLRWYLPADSGVQLACPYFRWKPELAEAILADWTAQIEAAGAWYVLVDDEQPMDVLSMPVAWEELARYQRPHAGIGIKLYRVRKVDDGS